MEIKIPLNTIQIFGSEEYYVECSENDVYHLREYERLINDGIHYETVNKLFSNDVGEHFSSITLPSIQKLVEGCNLLEKQKEYTEEYNTFFKAILEDENGNINKEQLMKELKDYSFLIENASKVYNHVTGNTFSKIMYDADTVIRVADDHFNQTLEEELKEWNDQEIDTNEIAHPDYNFLKEDKVFVTNSDGNRDFYLLIYDNDMGAYMLIPFTDKLFNDTKIDETGNTSALFVFEMGWDLLERVEDFNFEEL